MSEEFDVVNKHYIKNYERLVKVAFHRVGSWSDAEDVVQESYERALRYLYSCDIKNFDKWFNTIFNNCVRDYNRWIKYNSYDSFDEEDSEGEPCLHFSNQILEEIRELISTKSIIQMEVLNLYLNSEYRAIDISRITPHSYANCHKIIQRFREEVKELYFDTGMVL